MAVVYRHIRLDKNEVFYIGIGKDENRPYESRGRNIYWNRIVSKSNYKIEIIFDNISYEDAKIKEIEFIKLYGRKDLGLGTLCNMTDGGEGMSGYITSQETKDKISKTKSGKKNEKLSKLCKGLKKRLGAKLSNETKDKISKSLVNTRTGKNNHESKKIIDTNTGVIYYGKREAAEAYGIPLSTLKAYLTGRLKNKTTLEYEKN